MDIRQPTPKPDISMEELYGKLVDFVIDLKASLEAIEKAKSSQGPGNHKKQ